MSNKAHLTAIARTKPSNPVKYLYDSSKLNGRVLDFGCGRGADVRFLGCTGYDPHYSPEYPVGPFDTIVCNFVLNVIESDVERDGVLTKINDLLSADGVAYITVRNDKKRLHGETSKGTWQGLVELPFPQEKKTADWIMYRMVKCKYHSYCSKADSGEWFCPNCGRHEVKY